MPYNGTGTFVRVYSWVTDAANGLLVSSSRMDTDTDDIADGLSNCVTRDGQSAWTANLPAGGYKITGLGDGASGNDSVNYDQVFTDANSFSGLKTFSGGLTATGTVTLSGASYVYVPTVSAGDATTKAASTAFVSATAMSAALPGQTSNAGNFVTTDGTNASWKSVLTAPELWM